MHRGREHERIRDHRTFMQYASIGDFCEPIERITGRRVRAFVSGIDTLEDVSVETYVLHAKASDSPSRTDCGMRASAATRRGN